MNMPTEDPVRLIECLKSLGITKYEALVYIALLRVPNATASEIHESSGVPRASVYPVLDQLVDKDLVSVSQSTPKRFAATPPGDAITGLVGRIERDADYARGVLVAIHHEQVAGEQGSEELIWNLYGIDSIRKRLLEIIAGATREIRIIAHPDVLSAEVRALLSAVDKHVSIEIITSRWDRIAGENLKVFIRQHPAAARESGGAKDILAGGVCIVDGSRVMVIVGSGDSDMVALFSESEGFVRFFTRYFTLVTDWAKKPE